MDADLTNLRAVAADVRYRMDKKSADAVAWAADEIEALRNLIRVGYDASQALMKDER